MQISSFQYRMTYDLYIAAFAGAGITLLALVSDCASTRVNLAARPQWGTTIVLWHMWLSDGQSVGGEASQASMTDDSCTIALCSSFSADKDVRIMLSCLVLSTHANSAAIISCFQPVSLLRLSYVTLDKLWTFSSSKQVYPHVHYWSCYTGGICLQINTNGSFVSLNCRVSGCVLLFTSVLSLPVSASPSIADLYCVDHL